MSFPLYLDANATTILDPRVLEVMRDHWNQPLGNASAAHGSGRYAASIAEDAEDTLLDTLGAHHYDITWTSGATEANNTLIAALASRTQHLVVSTIEHASVLRPVQHQMQHHGLDVTWVHCDADGVVPTRALIEALRPDTGGVLLMAANNVTGALQPINALGDALPPEVWLHVDAAQAFGKGCILSHPRIDSLALSAHKLHGPVGVGALFTRRGADLPSLLHGGGQQQGRRAGTLPVPLIAGFAEAARLAQQEEELRRQHNLALRQTLVDFSRNHGAQILSPLTSCLPNTLCLRFPGLEASLLQAVWSPWVTVALGSACAAGNPDPSHVLMAMGLDAQAAQEALRISWSFQTPELPWRELSAVFQSVRRQIA